MIRYLGIISAFYALLVVGCSDEYPVAGSGETDAPLQERSFALIMIKNSLVSDGIHEALPQNAVNQIDSVDAYFVTHRNAERQHVLNVLRASFINLPQELGTDECYVTRYYLTDVSSYATEDVTINLMDAGLLHLRTPDIDVPLEIKYFPDILPIISGVTYQLPHSVHVPYDASRSYTISSDGSYEIGEFEIEVLAPQPFKLETLNGMEVDTIRLMGDEGVPFDWSQEHDLEIQWSNADEESDLFLLTLSRTYFDEVSELICLCQDDGEFNVPHALIQQLPAYPPPHDDDVIERLEARRVRLSSFAVQGVERGELSFIVEEILPLK